MLAQLQQTDDAGSCMARYVELQNAVPHLGADVGPLSPHQQALVTHLVHSVSVKQADRGGPTQLEEELTPNAPTWVRLLKTDSLRLRLGNRKDKLQMESLEIDEIRALCARLANSAETELLAFVQRAIGVDGTLAGNSELTSSVLQVRDDLEKFLILAVEKNILPKISSKSMDMLEGTGEREATQSNLMPQSGNGQSSSPGFFNADDASVLDINDSGASFLPFNGQSQVGLAGADDANAANQAVSQLEKEQSFQAISQLEKEQSFQAVLRLGDEQNMQLMHALQQLQCTDNLPLSEVDNNDWQLPMGGQQGMGGGLDQMGGQQGMGGSFDQMGGQQGMGGGLDQMGGQQGMGGSFDQMGGQQGLGDGLDSQKSRSSNNSMGNRQRLAHPSLGVGENWGNLGGGGGVDENRFNHFRTQSEAFTPKPQPLRSSSQHSIFFGSGGHGNANQNMKNDMAAATLQSLGMSGGLGNANQNMKNDMAAATMQSLGMSGGLGGGLGGSSSGLGGVNTSSGSGSGFGNDQNSGLATGVLLDGLPSRFRILPVAVQEAVRQLMFSSSALVVKDFDDKVVSKMALMAGGFGQDECLTMLSNLMGRIRTKQGAMKNGPGYLDVAVSSHLDMLKVCFGGGIIIRKLPFDSAIEKLRGISLHSFKNVDSVHFVDFELLQLVYVTLLTSSSVTLSDDFVDFEFFTFD
eukprot:gene14126-20085_t